MAADAEGPAVLAEADAVEVDLLLARRGGQQQAAEGADQRERDARGEVPEGPQALGPQPVDKVHGRDQPRLGSGAANVRQVAVAVGGLQRADDAAVQGDFGGEVGEVHVT